MLWQICFGCSIGILGLALLFILIKGKINIKQIQHLKTLNILFVAVFVSAVFLFLPIYTEIFAGEANAGRMVFLMALHNTVRLFVIDSDFDIIFSNAAQLSGLFRSCYFLYAALLYMVSPALTFGFVLSFFKNVSAYQKYLWHFNSDAYIFSELNEKSLALAQSLYENNPERLLVFTGVNDDNTELKSELMECAQEIKAICFEKDVQSVNFKLHNKKKHIYFFNISLNEAQNVEQALSLVGRYGEYKNAWLYLFASSVESEVLLSDMAKGEMKVRRINEVQSLISRELYDQGFELFANALPNETGTKDISAVIIGMGQYGTEMAKALPWFCQMDGYDIEINCFDKDALAAEKFSALCPELMDEKHNGTVVEGEAKYKIIIHPEMDVETKAFEDRVTLIKNVNYVFVALGGDDVNIKTAIKLRVLFERAGVKPRIQAVVRSKDKKEALQNISNFKGQKYDIEFIGDVESTYTEKVILESDLEEIALARHLKWGAEKDFWVYDYNYKSSIASAIHQKMKLLCGISGQEKAVKDRTEEELWNIRRLEHRRWNAYMRSEGYCYAPLRNDMAKTHHCLVPFDELSLKDQMKDDD